MKKFLIPTILIVAAAISLFIIFNQNDTFLDQNKQQATLPYAANEGEYSLLIIGEKNVSTEYVQKQINNSNLHKITRYNSYKEINYQRSTIKKSSHYILFNSKEPIFQTDNLEDLITYINNIK